MKPPYTMRAKNTWNDHIKFPVVPVLCRCNEKSYDIDVVMMWRPEKESEMVGHTKLVVSLFACIWDMGHGVDIIAVLIAGISIM